MTTGGSTKVVSGLGDGDVVAPSHGGGKGGASSHADASNTLSRKRQGNLSVLQLEPSTYARALDCVHCGLCLPACPTYTENGLEADSPRGRIVLMKELADGHIAADDAVLEHLDLCLDCRACETACPSGVVYHELIEETRTKLQGKRRLTLADRLSQLMFFHVFPYPRRLKLAMLGPRMLQKAGLWEPLNKLLPLPGKLAKMRQMLPPDGPIWPRTLEEQYAATPAESCPGPWTAGLAGGPVESRKKPTVGFFAGCIGSTLFSDVNRQSIALLQLAGCDVMVPRAQACCGAIHHHGGRAEAARDFAKQNIDAFVPRKSGAVDYIVTDIAGCGAMLKDYRHLMHANPAYAQRATIFENRVRDISQMLVELNLAPPTMPLEMTVTYHDACHLAHAQRITDAPRQLLASIPGLNVIPLVESEMCCGAAGTYNITQPEMAMQLGERKIRHIHATGAKICVTGNVGCAMQIQSEATRVGVELQVMHPVTLLHQAYFGRSQGT